MFISRSPAGIAREDFNIPKRGVSKDNFEIDPGICSMCFPSSSMMLLSSFVAHVAQKSVRTALVTDAIDDGFDGNEASTDPSTVAVGFMQGTRPESLALILVPTVPSAPFYLLSLDVVATSYLAGTGRRPLVEVNYFNDASKHQCLQFDSIVTAPQAIDNLRVILSL